MAGIYFDGNASSNPPGFEFNSSPVTCQMSALLTKAEQLVTEKTILGGSVVDQIKKLMNIGKSCIHIISDAEGKDIYSSPDLKIWLEKVNDVLLAAHDLLDEYDYHLHHHSRARAYGADMKESKIKVLNNFSSLMSMTSSLTRPIICRLVLSKTTRRFEGLNLILEKVLEDGKGNFASVEEGSTGKRSAGYLGMKDCSEIESQLVQKGNDVERIVTELLYSDNDKNLSLISLVGWADTGKTTLAQVVYKNPDVMHGFDERMWVQLDEELEMKRIAKGMLTTLTRSRVDDALTEEVVCRILQDRLRGKRYLLVLDGVWELDATLMDFLQGMGGCRGCKIVITLSTVPQIQSGFVHEMHLSPMIYWHTLFNRISYGGPEGGFTAPVDVCGGESLYIKMLGSLVYGMKDEIDKNKWISHELRRHGGNVGQLCFNYMSCLALKKCFQYCYIFPKGYLIQREELIEVWIAQGYLNLATPSVLEMVDLGLQYYEILLRGCFLQVSEDDDFDRRSCKVPDLLHGLLLHEESSGLFNTFENEVVSGFSKAVHLSISNCRVTFSRTLRGSFSGVRTLYLENTQGLQEFLAAAHSLRVLIVVDGSITELPASIGKLKRLKYLDISRTKILRLPDSFSKLYSLQTLRLYGLQNLPRNFENLVCLRHIYTQQDFISMSILPPSFQRLVKSSRSGASYNVFLGKDGVISGSEFLNLPYSSSSIGIHGLENAVSGGTANVHIAGLAKRHGMDSLKLQWCAGRDNSHDEDGVLESLKPHEHVRNLTIENFKGTTLPSWMIRGTQSICLLRNMMKLELDNCSWCVQLPSLGHLPSLRILKIVGLESVLRVGQDFYGSSSTNPAFPVLKVFILRGMSNLREWSSPSTQKAFPDLLRFEVDQCPNLICIPDIVIHQPSPICKIKVALCEKLSHLPGRLAGLERLEDLELFGLPALEKFSIPCASKLKCLIIGCLSPRMQLGEYLEKQLNHLSALTNLTIWRDRQSVVVPDWVASLDSLQYLKVESCDKLECFPSAPQMRNLFHLEEINIFNCPLLQKNCTRGSRPEWHKISHVPTIVVNNQKLIQQQGSHGAPASHDVSGPLGLNDMALTSTAIPRLWRLYSI